MLCWCVVCWRVVSALLVDMVSVVEMLILKELLQKVGVGMSAFLVDILME